MAAATKPTTQAWVAVPGGTFTLGSEQHYPEERPVRRVDVAPFWIAAYAVTNRQYADFVADTRYVTVAERPLNPADFPGAPKENLKPGSLVFTRTPGPVDLRHLSQWWTWTPGACWRHPEGPGSGIADRSDHPVVHIAYDDALAYCDWAGAELPTEAQWEAAARGGLDGATYVWGNVPERPGQRLANFWHGDFPWRSDPGYGHTARVGSFPANGYGLFDMAGNVWEWTRDWYESEPQNGPSCCSPDGPMGSPDAAQPQFRIPRRVLKGGSFLCADSYCRRYRPAARRPQMVDTGMSHIGFRCVRTEPPD
ncbi:formylglycine-generating enzyme family protein [Kribbella sp. NPDC004875]|uniref:formylglycine-generating enzyme family protein n=1 Tax=Kribbella sp. NPDC004875 TaxID=3364107 RepID=UPI00367D0AE4